MSAINDGGPAFPVSDYYRGMTLRDWFAGQALTGIVLSPLGQGGRITFSATAIDAYTYADAMLAAREKGGAK